MADQEIPDINEINNKFKEILNNTNWIAVTRRLTGYKFEWFLWRLRKAEIPHMTRDRSIHGEVVHVGEDHVIAALSILNEPIGKLSIPTTEITGNIVWDDLPNDHPIFKGQADDIPPPGTRLTGQFFDSETSEPLWNFPSEEK
jgi:hypothetical protein